MASVAFFVKTVSFVVTPSQVATRPRAPSNMSVASTASG